MSVNYGYKRLTTGAHYGGRDWIAQRVTAALIVLFTLVLLLSVLFTSGPISYDTWAGIFAPQWMKFLTLVTILALAWHAWIGVRDIWMDYVKPTWMRLLLEVLTITVLLAYAAWTAIILWGA